jgi:hypothetical protein
MSWIYVLVSILKIMKSKPPPLFLIFYGHHIDNTRDSHCAMSQEQDGGGGGVQ